MIYLSRWYNKDCTLGRLNYEHLKCFALELPDLGNNPYISCIPRGTYEYFKKISASNGLVLELKDVPSRTYIQIHSGNFTRNTKGCILVGSGIQYLDNDDIPDVINSGRTMKQLLKAVPEKGQICIS